MLPVSVYITVANFVIEIVQTELDIVELSVSLRNDDGYDFDRAFSLLFRWCQSALARI